ncbi:MAG: hypothetical protein M3347_15685 [Armatimonadota bacterium]|nr:hypothetical protein [Armatimonadota bacterium]
MPKSKTEPQPEKLSVANSFVSLLIGAVAADLVLLFLNLGLRELWLPVFETGGRVFRALTFSGIVGGVATAIAARGVRGPLAPAACALGWGVWGLLQHVTASGSFKNLPFVAAEPAARLPLIATATILNLGIFHPPCVAFGLLIAAVAAWITDQKIFAPQRAAASTTEAPSPSGKPTAVFLQASSYPLLTAVLGLVLISVLGLLLLLLPQFNADQLPMHVSRAWLCAAVSLCAFAVTAYVIRSRLRPAGSIGYLMAAPIVIVFSSWLIVKTQGQLVLLEPMKRLLWNSSPFELACWGALGAACGYWAAED